jgi:type VI secretion system protein ImpA
MNIKSLLKPITKGKPTGKDLRRDKQTAALYYDLKDLRQKARQLEQQSPAETYNPQVQAAWQKVYGKAQVILISHSKDFDVVTWLIEAQLRLSGLDGISGGFKLAAQMIQRFWADAFPSLDKDEPLSRLSLLIGLNGEGQPGSLIAPLGQIVITDAPMLTNYPVWQYKQALLNNAIEDKQKQQARIEASGVSLSDIQKAVAVTSKSFVSQLRKQLDTASESYQQLVETVHQVSGDDCFPSYHFMQRLAQINIHLDHLYPKAQSKTKHVSSAERQREDRPPTHQAAEGGARQLSDREQALAQIVEIADFFSEIEPHSPLPYLLNKAVHWANLPLPELLSTLIHEPTVLDDVFKLTGIEHKTTGETQDGKH